MTREFEPKGWDRIAKVGQHLTEVQRVINRYVGNLARCLEFSLTTEPRLCATATPAENSP
jgi:hypothetical protein